MPTRTSGALGKETTATDEGLRKTAMLPFLFVGPDGVFSLNYQLNFR